MKSVELVTDGGSCVGNPGPGGWACTCVYEGQERELTGSHPQSTNNRMELTAAIEGLRALKEPCVVILVTDSQYLSKGSRSSWRAGRGPAGSPRIESRYSTRTCANGSTNWSPSTRSSGVGNGAWRSRCPEPR